MGEHGDGGLWCPLAPGVQGRVDVPGIRVRGDAGWVGSQGEAAGPSPQAAPSVRQRFARPVPVRLVALAVVVLLTALAGAAVSVRAGGAGSDPASIGWGATALPESSGDAGPARAAPSPASDQVATPAPVDWWAVLADLDQRRSAALAARDRAAVATYAAPESSAWREDTALIAELDRLGLAPLGLGTRIVAVEEVAPSGPGSAVVVTLVDQRSAYALVDAGGRPVGQVPGSGSRRWRVTLVRAPGPADSESDAAADAQRHGWRVSQARALG